MQIYIYFIIIIMMIIIIIIIIKSYTRLLKVGCVAQW